MKKRRNYDDDDDRVNSSNKQPHLCATSGCEHRGTHSDSPGGSKYKCGFHFYAGHGGDEAIKEWQARDKLAMAQWQRFCAKLPKYPVFGKDAL